MQLEVPICALRRDCVCGVSPVTTSCVLAMRASGLSPGKKKVYANKLTHVNGLDVVPTFDFASACAPRAHLARLARCGPLRAVRGVRRRCSPRPLDTK